MDIQRILELRRQYGDSVFTSELPDGRVVPWKALPIGQFLLYDKLSKHAIYPVAFIEDLIFKECVLDDALTSNLGKLRAGIVTTVVADILRYSGPRTLEDLQNSLENSRAEIGQALHQLIGIVCQAFPAYKPEEVYSMDFRSLSLRVAQAEDKLMRSGFLAEPLQLSGPDEEAKEPSAKHRPPPKEDKRSKRLKELFEQQKKAPPPPAPSSSINQKTTVISGVEIAAHHSATSGFDEVPIVNSKEAKEISSLYDDYLKQMQRGEKVKIKTHEELQEAALARAEENRKKVIQMQKEAKKQMIDEQPALLKAKEEAKKRKARRATRRQ